MLDSPNALSPVSPVVFTRLDSPMDVEDSVARRLTTLGFVEVESPRPSLDRSSSDQTLYSTTTASTLPPDDDDSPSSKGSLEERREEVEIRVELVSTASAREHRASRLWVCEKKGKRWIERNYDEILQQLRKL